jgi:hypothetical protein
MPGPSPRVNPGYTALTQPGEPGKSWRSCAWRQCFWRFPSHTVGSSHRSRNLPPAFDREWQQLALPCITRLWQFLPTQLAPLLDVNRRHLRDTYPDDSNNPPHRSKSTIHI